jgi:hypothetical protein
MANLENKKIHPILAVILNWVVLGILGYILLGQTSKSLYILAATMIGLVLCVLPGTVIGILALIDVYMVADAVKRGEEVDENEYKIGMLHSICKMIHKDAVFKG